MEKEHYKNEDIIEFSLTISRNFFRSGYNSLYQRCLDFRNLNLILGKDSHCKTFFLLNLIARNLIHCYYHNKTPSILLLYTDENPNNIICRLIYIITYNNLDNAGLDDFEKAKRILGEYIGDKFLIKPKYFILSNEAERYYPDFIFIDNLNNFDKDEKDTILWQSTYTPIIATYNIKRGKGYDKIIRLDDLKDETLKKQSNSILSIYNEIVGKVQEGISEHISDDDIVEDRGSFYWKHRLYISILKHKNGAIIRDIPFTIHFDCGGFISDG